MLRLFNCSRQIIPALSTNLKRKQISECLLNGNRLHKLQLSQQVFCSTEKKEEKKDRPPGIGLNPNANRTSPKGPISWTNLAVSGVIIGILFGIYKYARAHKEAAIAADRKRIIGKAKIGGTFDLIDHNGKPCKSEDFQGQWLLLYFGFTHCPDICPEELEKVAEVTDLFEKDKRPIQPIFISVDPKRDGVKEISEYVKEFHPKLIGVTGTEDQIKKTCKSYRVYYSPGPKDEDEDYIVDHTIIVYVINPEGEFVDYYGQTKSAKMIYNSINMHMLKYESSKGVFNL